VAADPIRFGFRPNSTTVKRPENQRKSLTMIRSMFAGIVTLSFLTFSANFALAQESQKYEDSDFDFSMSVPSEWKKVGSEGFTVPGKLRAAFKGPGASSIVAFVQEPGQDYDARFLVDASSEALKAALKVELKESEVRQLGGKTGMWLIVEGPGNGGAILGQGDVKTIQHWAAVPREKDIVVLILSCPSEDYPTASKVYSSALASLKVGGTQTDKQKDAK